MMREKKLPGETRVVSWVNLGDESTVQKGGGHESTLKPLSEMWDMWKGQYMDVCDLYVIENIIRYTYGAYIFIFFYKYIYIYIHIQILHNELKISILNRFQ